ncbi:TPR repeat-containing protein [Gossypium arboreum]|uniref:TPR repeat-containing protein n=1 Tax=Gossypium arboreum TaxID=29729 RepID=A0A0B0PC33_GOSAR|nr:TPR repeat-containing protein [Gossypium arboreum]
MLSRRRNDHKPYLTEAIEEQIEDVYLIFLKLQAKQIEAANLISLKLHWSRLKLQGICQKM